ncbi:hypothetical protein L9W92_18125 [Pelotomaculum terephthalicicum JT]|uniref:hypothetical protein n=1 Tax=Pelotomaculum terephthalicicum TaxID=206393 RepID=UPI001F034AE6|nr:hypothetical protein [Pelotomaculum terephthalicicum]MCG9969915.1 hypothetical protein [Pelotomaculum terephthalicicum JT]
MTLNEIIETTMKEAIIFILSHLRYEFKEADTHNSVIFYGEINNDLIEAIAHYLVGIRACAIDAALNIRADLIGDTDEDKIELYADICSIVGENNNALTMDQIQDERNPWLSEGIFHLFMNISTRLTNIHPPGLIIALDLPHVSAKDKGLDLMALYLFGDNLGISIIETKAYKDDPNKAINKAVNYFKEIEQGKHAPRIRQSIQTMRTSLPPSFQKLVSSSLWKKNRSYIPNPHYDASVPMNWSNRRPSLNDLSVGKTRIIIMPHIINNFDTFFNSISENMRDFARGL